MVDAEVAAMHARAGDRLGAIMESTGMDEARIREMARDTLRIQAYLNQRFGTTVQVSDAEVTQYYRAHPEEFTRSFGERNTISDASGQAACQRRPNR